jgi:hypothetical protein
MKQITKSILAVLAIGCGMLSQAQALPTISGSISFFGTGTVGTVGSTTSVIFDAPQTVDNTPAPTGSFAGTAGTVATTFSPIVFTGSGNSATLNAALTPLWSFTFGGNVYSFDLAALTSGSANTNTVDLAGYGTVHITGFEDSSASFSLHGTNDGTILRFQIGDTTAAVPDGGSAIALLGIAMVGIEGFRRKLKLA